MVWGAGIHSYNSILFRNANQSFPQTLTFTLGEVPPCDETRPTMPSGTRALLSCLWTGGFLHQGCF